MEQNTTTSIPEKLIEAKEKMLEVDKCIHFSQDELGKLNISKARMLEEHFHGRAMMALPEDEIEFFEWLKKNDRPVWDDLWEEEEQLYCISIDFLHHFLKYSNGFPICDLISVDNYWFTGKHIKPKGLERMEDIGAKVNSGKTLSFEEAFLVEIFRGSIDLWHFCYRYKVPVEVAKRHIDEMHHEDLIVHLSERDDLVKYLDV
jgi:hypothetical protein